MDMMKCECGKDVEYTECGLVWKTSHIGDYVVISKGEQYIGSMCDCMVGSRRILFEGLDENYVVSTSQYKEWERSETPIHLAPWINNSGA